MLYMFEEEFINDPIRVVSTFVYRVVYGLQSTLILIVARPLDLVLAPFVEIADITTILWPRAHLIPVAIHSGLRIAGAGGKPEQS
jgi:hypothetical protein